MREIDIFSLHLSAYCCIAIGFSDFLILFALGLFFWQNVCTSINQILRCNCIKGEFLQSLVTQNKWKSANHQSARQRKWSQSRLSV